MRTEIEALKEIHDRISYFCSRTDGKYDPPWAQEVIGIIDDVLTTPLNQEAHRRELSKNVSKNGADFGQLGDAAKLREACAKAAESAAEIMERVRHKDGLAFNTANYIVGVAKDALAEPSRNCDVGTPREQNERFVSFCASHYSGAEAMKTDDGPCDCPCWVNGQGCNCFVWSQKPYEEGGDK